MRRRVKRRDKNQTAIAGELAMMGYSVADTSGVGDGFGDCVIGKHGRTEIVEIKNPDSKYYTLLDSQKHFGQTWKGSAVIVGRTSEAINAEFMRRVQGPNPGR